MVDHAELIKLYNKLELIEVEMSGVKTDLQLLQMIAEQQSLIETKYDRHDYHFHPMK